MQRKIRILTITYTTWREDNNLGNSYSNIFKGMDDRFEFASIYFKDTMPENTLCHNYFHISEKKLFKSIFSRKPVGEGFFLENPMDTPKQKFSSAYNKARSLRWEIFLLMRDYMASWGNWHSKELDAFIENFKPDLIFGNLHYIPVINRLMVYAKNKFNIPLVLYPWDDFYSLKRISYSPVFWTRYLLERRLIYKCATNCDFMYTITKQMQEEYRSYFGKDSHILYKGHVFEGDAPVRQYDRSKPIKVVYMGYIGAGRWKVLAQLAQVIREFNNDSKNIEMFVYTMSPHTPEIENGLNIKGACKLMDPIPSEETMEVMNSANVLVHVEPVNNADMYIYRLSFSTKLVDYFYNAKCVLAIGGNTASMSYLKENDAAFVVNDVSETKDIFRRLLDNPELIETYGKKAWVCGMKNHKIENIQSMVYADFCNIVKEREL